MKAGIFIVLAALVGTGSGVLITWMNRQPERHPTTPATAQIVPPPVGFTISTDSRWIDLPPTPHSGKDVADVEPLQLHTKPATNRQRTQKTNAENQRVRLPLPEVYRTYSLEEQRARRIIEQHADWLFARNPDGSFVRNAAGRLVLTELGRVYAGYVLEADCRGIKDVKEQHAWAFDRFVVHDNPRLRRTSAAHIISFQHGARLDRLYSGNYVRGDPIPANLKGLRWIHTSVPMLHSIAVYSIDPLKSKSHRLAVAGRSSGLRCNALLEHILRYHGLPQAEPRYADIFFLVMRAKTPRALQPIEVIRRVVDNVPGDSQHLNGSFCHIFVAGFTFDNQPIMLFSSVFLWKEWLLGRDDPDDMPDQ